MSASFIPPYELADNKMTNEYAIGDIKQSFIVIQLV